MDLKESALRPSGSHERHPWELARLQVLRAFLRRHLPGLCDRQTVVLDVGCGDLFVAKELASEHPQIRLTAADLAYTEEQSRDLTKEFADRRLPIRVFSDVKLAVADAGGRIDGVFLLDVLEHIQDDAGFMKFLGRFGEISEDTVFFIIVPACPSLYSSHDLFLEHFRRYTSEALQRCMKESDYVIEESGSMFTSLLVPRLFQVVFERLLKIQLEQKGASHWRGRPLLNRLIAAFLVADYRCGRLFRKFGLKPLGLSHYVIARIRGTHD